MLVPDPIYLPVVQPGLSTRLTQSLLDGPTPWLAPSVATAFPAGTAAGRRLRPGGERGGARRPLLHRPRRDRADARRQLAAQLVWTARAAVRRDCGAHHRRRDSPAGRRFGQQSDDAGLDVVRPGCVAGVGQRLPGGQRGLVRLFDTKLLPVEGYVGSAGATITDPAVSSDASTIAVLSLTGPTASEQLAESPGNLVRVATGTDFARLSSTRSGLLWLVDRTNRGTPSRSSVPTTPLAVRSPRLRDGNDPVAAGVA